MATGWVKSLHCKSSALEDVVVFPSKPTKKKPLLPLDCGYSSHALKDVVLLFPRYQPLPKEKPSSKTDPPSQSQPKPTTKPVANPKPPKPIRPPLLAAPPPTLAALPPGHSSRRVVEIIFGSSWSSRGTHFPGEIEMLFRVHHPPRAVARFEEYRAAVSARASASDDARLAADGNEMMRFHCATSASSAAAGDDDAIYDAGVAACDVKAGIRTFAGSGGAHESGGGGSGRRSMLVCRVIAGRVRSGSTRGRSSEYESVSAEKGELLVFDARAVLPCFLIIYNL